MANQTTKLDALVPETGNTQVDGTTVHRNEVAAKKAELEAEIARLNNLEAKSVPGARPRTPRAQMLDASDVEAKDPDNVYRFVNIRDPQKAAAKIEDGYKKVPTEEGGRTLGDEFALMRVSKERHAELKANVDKITAFRESAHVREMENAAESVARQLRDQHGLNVDPRHILN